MNAHLLDSSHDANYSKQEKWLKEQWAKNLERLDVKWPEKAHVARAQLVGLSFFLGEPVNKDSLGQFVKRIAGGGLDTQVRHLRGDGWNVIGSGRGEGHTNHLPNGLRVPKGSYVLVSVTTPATDYVQSLRLKRSGRAAAHSWDELCKYYQNKCAHCGKITMHPDKGHLDPNKSQEIDNLLPLCPSCNNWAANDVIFGQDGRVKTVLSKRFLVDAPREALTAIFSWLKGELK